MKLKDIQTYFNKISVFYFPQKAGYWNSLTKCQLTKKPTELGDYYLDFSSKADYPDELSFDGIPLFSHQGKPKIEHPIVIAQYALGLHAIINKNYIETDTAKDRFMLQANWFIKNKVDILGGTGWYIKNLYPNYDLNEPWVSAMAQGEAISVLTRAAKISNQDLFAEMAIDALAPFEFDIKEGGVKSYFKSNLIYEEFPTPIKPMAVLNGFIFSLFGLFDLWLLNGNSKAKSLFTDGIESLKNLLTYYDLNFWTQYYLFDYPKKYYSSFTYHILVTEQLKALYWITNEDIFLKYFKKWDRYSKSLFKRNIALLKKVFSSNKIFNY